MIKKFYSDRALSVSFLTAMAMVAADVSAWVAIFSAVFMIWKWGVERGILKQIPRKMTGFIGVLVFAQVIFEFRTLIGQDPAYTFLLALSALRVMDYQNERDHKFVVLLGFTLISVKSLFSLDIYWALPSAVAFAGLWYSLIPATVINRQKVLLKIFILSLPLAVVLFFAFPRLVIPWALSRGSSAQGEIGFSDELNPGGVADIAANNALAFRAKISALPLRSSAELYWRGAVLNHSQGLSWRQGRPGFRSANEHNSKLPTYEVATEPTGQGFLFTLDGTRQVLLEGGNVVALNQSVFRSSRVLTKASVYRGGWEEGFVDTNAPEESDLQVPILPAKVREWANTIKAKNLDVPGRLRELQGLYANGGFFYTLNPGAYGPNELEEFLFKRKLGFCEHFAGSYGTLARALDIPTRVVVGYQGGRFNPRGDFWKISQKDAHAWAEVFVDGSWQRKDPTMWVAPLRLTIGAEDFFDLSEEDQKAFAKTASYRPTKNLSLFWDQATFVIEDLNYQWTYFLIDFDRGAQLSFFENLSRYRAQTMVVILLIFALGAMVVRFLFRTKKMLSEEQRLIAEVESWAVKKKIERPLNQPPAVFLRSLGEQFPQLKETLVLLEEYYDQKVYAGKKPEVTAEQLLGRWRMAIKKM